MLKKMKYIIGILLIVWLVFFITDFSLSRANKPPIFAVPLTRYKDGGSTEYYGLGYKVIKYMNLTAERGIKLGNVDFGTWFMKFSPSYYFPENDGEETTDTSSIQLTFIEEDLLNNELPLLQSDDIKEILGVRYVKDIKQTLYTPVNAAVEDIGLKTYSYITINSKDYYLGASMDIYVDDEYQRFNLIKSYIGEDVFEFREVLGANSMVTNYIQINNNRPIMIANLGGDLFSKDIDDDGIIESIGTIGTAPETTIYNWDLNNNKIYYTNLNGATDSLAVLYEQNNNNFMVFKDGSQFIYEYDKKRLKLID